MQVLILDKINYRYFIKFLTLLALATGAPLLGFHSQWVTGPIVNAALILSVFLLDIRGAMLIGLLPSTIALSTGLLPATLASMVPFIIISNVIFVLVIDYFFCHSESRVSEMKNPLDSDDMGFKGFLRQTQDRPLASLRTTSTKYWFGLILAAGLKFLFLFVTSGLVIKLLLNQKLTATVLQMMSWPQLFTAIIGGMLAFGILKMLKNKKAE